MGEFIKKITALGIRHRVVLLTEANFSPDSPLSKLTEKQREVLIAAYKLGYYDIPRRINSEKLAKKLNIGGSTLGEHLEESRTTHSHRCTNRNMTFSFVKFLSKSVIGSQTLPCQLKEDCLEIYAFYFPISLSANALTASIAFLIRCWSSVISCSSLILAMRTYEAS